MRLPPGSFARHVHKNALVGRGIVVRVACDPLGDLVRVAAEDALHLLVFRLLLGDLLVQRFQLENGTITDYRGTYEQFREYRARQTALQQTAKAVERKKEPKPKPKRAPNTTRARERTEREIEKLEEQLAALDAESEANATDYQKLMEIDARKQALNAQLEALYEAWEALCE